MAAEEVRRFGLAPKVALLSHSNFGSDDSPSARKMSRARELIAAARAGPGSGRRDARRRGAVRRDPQPRVSRLALKGEANLLVMPNLDAANISFNLLKMTGGEGVTIGPILLGAAKPVHILTPSATVRRLVNMTALAVVDAGAAR